MIRPWDDAAQRIQNYPVASGLAEGLAASGLLLVGLGAAGPAARWVMAPVLAWAMLSHQRPVAYQVALAAVLALGADVACGRLLGAGLPLFGAALLAANLATGEGGTERWQRGHAVHAVAACGAAWGAALILGLAKPAWFGPPERVGALLGSMLAVGGAALAVAGLAAWRSHRARREPRLARWSA